MRRTHPHAHVCLDAGTERVIEICTHMCIDMQCSPGDVGVYGAYVGTRLRVVLNAGEVGWIGEASGHGERNGSIGLGMWSGDDGVYLHACQHITISPCRSQPSKRRERFGPDVWWRPRHASILTSMHMYVHIV